MCLKDGVLLFGSSPLVEGFRSFGKRRCGGPVLVLRPTVAVVVVVVVVVVGAVVTVASPSAPSCGHVADVVVVVVVVTVAPWLIVVTTLGVDACPSCPPPPHVARPLRSLL